MPNNFIRSTMDVRQLSCCGFLDAIDSSTSSMSTSRSHFASAGLAGMPGVDALGALADWPAPGRGVGGGAAAGRAGRPGVDALVALADWPAPGSGLRGGAAVVVEVCAGRAASAVLCPKMASLMAEKMLMMRLRRSQGTTMLWRARVARIPVCPDCV